MVLPLENAFASCKRDKNYDPTSAQAASPETVRGHMSKEPALESGHAESAVTLGLVAHGSLKLPKVSKPSASS